MSNYKKFTLDTIKQKLKNGDYEAPVGAMRAIGKTQELSEADKEKARALVRKHFGVEAPAPAARKPAKKAKKVAKKAAPKAAVKKKVAKKAAAASPTSRTVAKKTRKKSKRGRAAAPAEGDTEAVEAPVDAAAPASPAFAEQPTKVSASSTLAPPRSNGSGNVVLEMGQVISTVGEALKSMEAAKRLFPKAKLEHDVEVATGAMARAVRIIDQEIMSPRLVNGGAAATKATVRKKASKKGTRAKASTTTPPPAEETTESVLAEGEGHILTEEELSQLALARETQAG